MKINQDGIDLVKSFEGVRLAPYKDAVGIPTIGIGATFYQDGRKVTMKDAPLTEKQVEDLLRFHLKQFEDEVTKLLAVPVSSNQFSALVSFAFNVGSANLSKSTLLKKLNNHDYAGAAEEFLRWDKAGGKVLAGLTRRRKAERDLFLKADVVESNLRNSLLPEGPSSEEIEKLLKDIEKNILG